MMLQSGRTVSGLCSADRRVLLVMLYGMLLTRPQLWVCVRNIMHVWKLQIMQPLIPHLCHAHVDEMYSAVTEM